MEEYQHKSIEYLGALFDFPTKLNSELVSNLGVIVKKHYKISESHFLMFEKYTNQATYNDLLENYTALFDLNPTLISYIGYYLFGESYMRSQFILELTQRFAVFSFDYGRELPDFLPVMLRFISLHPEEILSTELIEDAIIPAINLLLWDNIRPEDMPHNPTASHAYYGLFKVLRSVLTDIVGIEEMEIDNKEAISLNVLGQTSNPLQEKMDYWITKRGSSIA